jgi:hypothetical protein
MKVFSNYFISVWLVISLIWCMLVGIVLPPAGAQVNNWAVVGYLLAGPAVIAVILILLHSVDVNIFSSLQKATPIGAVFVTFCTVRIPYYGRTGGAEQVFRKTAR